MAINIPSKSEKNASQLRDALRILAWQQFKSENAEIKGLEGYAIFDEEWKTHEVHEMNEVKLLKFIKDLGYSLADILGIRTEYYQKRNEMNGNSNIPTEISEPVGNKTKLPF